MELKDICEYVSERVATATLTTDSYISTENMLPDKGGVVVANGVPSSNAVAFVKGDVLVSNIRPYFKKIWQADKKGGCSADVLCFRPNENVDSKYFYYLLSQQSFFDYMMSGSKGCKMPRGDKKQIMQWLFDLPSFEEQKRIASILSSLDNKIELNRRINDNLEQQAQALFKSWFVDFEPFKDGEFVDSELGMIPKGWEIGTIEDLCQNIASGSTPSSMNQEYYNGQIKWFTTKELKDSFLIDSEKHISDEGHNNSSTKMFPRGTVLMAIYAAPTVGRLGILTSDATFNQAAVGLNPKQEIGSNYVFLLLKKERDSFNNLAIGAAQQNLSVKFVKTYPTIIPSKKVFVDFNVLVKPLFDRISLLSIEIETMTKTRDTLLPKLMSGELKIGRVEI